MGSVLFKRSVVWFALIQAFKGGLTPAPALAHELPTCSLPSAFLVVEWSKRFIPLIEQDLLSPHSTALFPITTARELRQMGAVANPRSILMRALTGDESNRPQLRPDPESPDRFYALAGSDRYRFERRSESGRSVYRLVEFTPGPRRDPPNPVLPPVSPPDRLPNRSSTSSGAETVLNHILNWNPVSLSEVRRRLIEGSSGISGCHTLDCWRGAVANLRSSPQGLTLAADESTHPARTGSFSYNGRSVSIEVFFIRYSVNNPGASRLSWD